jgi:hypothetical protein
MANLHAAALAIRLARLPGLWVTLALPREGITPVGQVIGVGASRFVDVGLVAFATDLPVRPALGLAARERPPFDLPADRNIGALDLLATGIVRPTKRERLLEVVSGFIAVARLLGDEPLVVKKRRPRL